MTTHESWDANVIQQPKETTSSSSWWFNIWTHKATWKQSLQPCRKHHAVAAGTWVGICHANAQHGDQLENQSSQVFIHESWEMEDTAACTTSTTCFITENILIRICCISYHIIIICTIFMICCPFLGLAVMHDTYLHWTNIILYIVKYHS